MPLVPFAAQRLVQSHGGPLHKNIGLILHVQAGNNSPYGWFSNSRNKASSTWWISKRGVVEQYVDSDAQAWTQGDGNKTYNSVETEGYPHEPLTEAHIDSLAKLYAWGHRFHGWQLILAEQPGSAGFGWHGMGGKHWGGHPGCPGDIRKGQRLEVLRRAQVILRPPPATPRPVRVEAVQAFGDNMIRKSVHIPELDKNGNGWIDTGIPWEKFISCVICGPAPDRDGYEWSNIYWSANNSHGQARLEFEGGKSHQSLDVVLWGVS